MSRRDLQLLAEGWDKCVKSLRYEDGSPVESTNPYRKMLEGLDVKEKECSCVRSVEWGGLAVNG